MGISDGVTSNATGSYNSWIGRWMFPWQPHKTHMRETILSFWKNWRRISNIEEMSTSISVSVVLSRQILIRKCSLPTFLPLSPLLLPSLSLPPPPLLPFIDPKLQAVPLGDTYVAPDAPRIAIEEMLQQMTLGDPLGTQGEILPEGQEEGTMATE